MDEDSVPIRAFIEFNQQTGIGRFAHQSDIDLTNVLSHLRAVVAASGEGENHPEIPESVLGALRTWLRPGAGTTWVLLALESAPESSGLSVREVLSQLSSQWLGTTPSAPGYPAGVERWAPEAETRVHPISLGLGPGLYKETFAPFNDLRKAFMSVRVRLAQDLGVELPAVVFRTCRGRQGAYEWRFRESLLGKGEVTPGHMLLLAPPRVLRDLRGIRDTHPGNGLPAIWVDPDVAQRVPDKYPFFTVPQVIASHLWSLCQEHPDQLVTRSWVLARLKSFAKSHRQLADEFEARQVPPSLLRDLLKALLREGVSVKDLEAIVESLLDHYAPGVELPTLLELARVRLSSTLCDKLLDGGGVLNYLPMPEHLEKMMSVAEPEWILGQLQATIEALPGERRPRAILVSSEHRAALGRWLRSWGRDVVALKPSELLPWLRVRNLAQKD
ncbi:MAG: FHIPEP family type III secretion protein [Candidatus Eremiobacteraeota bacterium]|nr:FHIPEP family type III secretion protein [Candidatus Eremiobacteraeota bacterium]